MQQADLNATPNDAAPPIPGASTASDGAVCTRKDAKLLGVNASYVIPAGTLAIDLASDACIFTGEALAILSVAAETQCPDLIVAATRLVSMAHAAMDAAYTVAEPLLSQAAATR